MPVSMVAVWSVLTLVLLVVEFATYGLTSIWFAIGSLCALVTALLGAPLWLQILWFILISILTLALTRPLVKKYINGRALPTNADRVIGMLVPVREAIDNLNGTGAVFADGKLWTARSAGGETLRAGEIVRVREIRGVTLIVSAAERSPDGGDGME